MRLIDIENATLSWNKEDVELYEDDFAGGVLFALDKLTEEVPTIDAVKVVRCKDCAYWKPPYMIDDEGNEKPWDGHIKFGEEAKIGVYVSGKCKHRLNTAYHTTDMAFRKEADFCSNGVLFDPKGR